MISPGLLAAASLASVLAAGCSPAASPVPAPAHSVIITGNVDGTPAAATVTVPSPPARYVSRVCIGPDGTYGVRSGVGGPGTIEVVMNDPACKVAAP